MTGLFNMFGGPEQMMRQTGFSEDKIKQASAQAARNRGESPMAEVEPPVAAQPAAEPAPAAATEAMPVATPAAAPAAAPAPAADPVAAPDALVGRRADMRKLAEARARRTTAAATIIGSDDTLG